jgi:PKD repeat protein
MKRTYFTIILIIVFSKLLFAYKFNIEGSVYYGSVDVAFNYPIFIINITNSTIDTTYTNEYGKFYKQYNISDDSIYMYNIFTIDTCNTTNPNPSYNFNSYEGTKYVNFEICENSNCISDFYYFLTAENSIQFFDYSYGEIIYWKWDFGDEYISYEQNPVHKYSKPDKYDVTLEVITVDSMSCSSIQTINLNEHRYLSGTVYVGENPLPEGKIFAFQTNLYKVDYNPVLNTSFEITGGKFKIPFFYSTYYIFYVIPEISAPGNFYPEYMPTYSGNVSFWEYSTPEVTDTLNFITINLLKRDSIFYGHGTVNGDVIFDYHYVVNLNDACVLLLDTDYKPLKYSLINYNNTFSLNNLPYGDYYLKIVKTGVSSDFMYISISENSPIKNVTFIVNDKGIISSINNVQQTLQTNIFPNPFTDIVNIDLNNNTNRVTTIDIIDYSGRVILQKQKQSVNGKLQLNLTELKRGFYFIRINEKTYKIQKNR